MSEKIIIIGHGSPRKEANNMDSITTLLHSELHPGCMGDCVKEAYLQFSEPDIETVIGQCVSAGAKKIIMHPFFLNAGMHVTKDIPDLISEARLKYPDVEFIFTEPLGMHNKLVEVVKERIAASRGYAPQEIEKRSFEIIGDEANLGNIPSEQVPVVKRVIHATADFEFAQTLTFHPDAIRTVIAAIRAGKDILTDVEMVRTGISKKLLSRWGGKVICGIQDAESNADDTDHRTTRSERGIELALKNNNNIGVIAIGNAPTALIKAVDILNSRSGASDTRRGIAVIGVPVGFVKALESKTLLASQSFPFITNLSRKGGSTIAVAIVNALLKMAEEER